MSGSLCEAAMCGLEAEVALRLDLGEDINQRPFPRFSSPLHEAVICGRANVVDMLLRRGADVDLCDYRGHTALSLAKRYHQAEIAARLEALGASAEPVPEKDALAARLARADAQADAGVPPPWRTKPTNTPITSRETASNGHDANDCNGNGHTSTKVHHVHVAKETIQEP